MGKSRGGKKNRARESAGDCWGPGIRGSPAPVDQGGDLTKIGLSYQGAKRDTEVVHKD